MTFLANFNEVSSRLGTFSTQWDFVQDRFGEKDLLPFSISDMDFPIPAGTAQVLKEAVDKGYFGYTRWNHMPFKSSITHWFQSQFMTAVPEEAVLYSPSVIYSLSVCLQLLSQPQDKVVTFTPCYDAFFHCIKQNQRELITFDLTNEAGNFTIDFERLAQVFQLQAPRVFLLCNPHNPTGRVFTEQELLKLIALCNEYKVALISDEIHMDVRRPGFMHLPILKYKDYCETDLVLLSSPSKTFNTPGLGGSYLIVEAEALRQQFLEVLKGRDGLSSVPYLSLLATMDCYRNQSQWVAELNQTVDDNFSYLKTELQKDPRIQFTIPEATYLAWIDVSQLPTTMDVLQNKLIHEEKVAIMRGDTYGEAGQGFLRLNLGAPLSKIKAGTAKLLRVASSL